MGKFDERYARQEVLEQIGPDGQQRLLRSSVLLVGCGALGCAQAQLLARAGVGRLLLADRDLVEVSNLQRQLLFEEEDATEQRPKAEAAARRLRRVNSTIDIEPLVTDVTARNVEALVAGVDLVLDATDNIETRYVLNDACVKLGKPWVYGGAIGVSGTVMTIRPGAGPCLRCLFPDPPPPGSLPTCDLAGVLNSAPAIVGALQVTEAIKLLTGKGEIADRVLSLDLWAGAFRAITLRRDPRCRCCAERRFEFLEARQLSLATSLCGRNAVQISPARDGVLALEALAAQLAVAGKVAHRGSLLQLQVPPYELLVFRDGRAIVKGTSDEAIARSLYARYVGS